MNEYLNDSNEPLDGSPNERRTTLLQMVRQSLEIWAVGGVTDFFPLPQVTVPVGAHVGGAQTGSPKSADRPRTVVPPVSTSRDATPPSMSVHPRAIGGAGASDASSTEPRPTSSFTPRDAVDPRSTTTARPSPPPRSRTSVPSRLSPSLSVSGAPSPELPPRVLPPDEVLAAMDRAEALAVIDEHVRRCTRCAELVATRTQTVFGAGCRTPRLVFMGEAPGADEDLQGVPFVGRAGRLLTDMIEKGMKISRDDVYILNTLRCRPPGNRTPLPTEAMYCREYLDAQLAVLRPEFICCLGAVASQALLNVSIPISKLRGILHPLGSIRVLCTYHPAYLLRNPSAKRLVWEDLQILMREMGLRTPT
ncbi:MAG: uracil-DNA glycosylase family protein [Planctomycetia bacterium]|nr:uracil-DNA glycosylase family protein [Planctomycetia bacterium]